MKKSSMLLFALALAGCGAVEDDSVAAHEEALGLRAPPPQLITLTVDSVEPAQPMEDRPVYLHFTLGNYTDQARSGSVMADADTGTFPATVNSSTWATGTIPARSEVTGVVALRPFYAGNVSYRIHYYENGVAKESTGGDSTLSVATRADFGYTNLAVDDAADSLLGDRVTAFFDVSRNGTNLSHWELGLGVMHDHSSAWLAPNPSFRADLLPGSGDTVRIDSGAWVDPWVFGSRFAAARKIFQWTAEAVRTVVPDQTFGSTGLPQSVFAVFCGGFELSGFGDCPQGSNFQYRPQWSVTRLRGSVDTVSLPSYVIQVAGGNWYPLDPSFNYTLQSGGGTVFNFFGSLYFAAPSGIGLTKLLVSGGGRTATLFIGYQ